MALGACRGGEDSRDPVTQPPSGPTRAFHLGFTPFPHDVNQAAIDFAYEKVSKEADLVAHHFDNGIPWNEALADSYPYHQHIMDDWTQRKAKVPAGHKIYVAVTPISGARNGLALYRKEADDIPLVAPFDQHGTNLAFDHDDVKTAYLNYCKRVIAFFKPDYLNIGIEVNLLRRDRGQAVWDRYKALNAYVYAELKKLHPTLPIFVSIAGQPLLQGWESPPSEFSSAPDPARAFRDSQLAALSDAMASSDYYGVSFYPYISAYLGSLFPASFPATMWDELFNLSAKPIAIAETGYPAADITALSPAIFVGSQAAQAAYLRKLFEEADKRKFKFVVNFVIRDYTALCQAVSCPAFAYLWETTGVFDASGSSRESLKVYREYLARPVKP
jgi:hypothetical protein